MPSIAHHLNYQELPNPSAPLRAVKPEYIRLPLPSSRCPYTNLSRSTLSEIATPCPANNYNPPVQSHVIKKRGAIRGIRVINYDSLMAFLASLPNDATTSGGPTRK